MKRCPQCRRDYTDETLNFCLDDGAQLVDGAGDGAATAILPGDGYASESPTKSLAERDSDPDLGPPPEPVKAPRTGAWRMPVLVICLISVAGFFFYSFYPVHDRPSAIDSIAVLPFQNRNTDADTEYLSSGLAESLIYRLSQLPDLRVSPTSTVFRYEGADIDPVKVGTDLGVSAVLSGRIVQHGDRLTISADLVDVRNNKVVWGEQYDRQISDLLSIQREIAREIVDRLKLKVAGDDRAIAKNYTESNEAYQLYLKGRFYWNKRNPEAIKKAIQYFDQAITADPRFALAYAGLADAYVVPANRLAPADAMPKAKVAAMRALELDDTLAEAHTSLARVLQVFEWNWLGAEKEFKRAIELNPRYPVAHQWYGGYLERTGRVAEGISERQLALELDPLSSITNFELAQGYYFARDYDRAIKQYQATLELDPRFPAALQSLPIAFAQKGDFNQAIDAVGAITEDVGLRASGSSGYVYAVVGRTSEARATVEKLISARKQEYISAVSIAFIYAGLGEKDLTFLWLEKGYEEHAFQMQYLNVEPRWDPLRSDPRFSDLVKRVGFPE